MKVKIKFNGKTYDKYVSFKKLLIFKRRRTVSLKSTKAKYFNEILNIYVGDRNYNVIVRSF